MDLTLPTDVPERYKSPSKIAQWQTEAWTLREVECPACRRKLEQARANMPVLDFECPLCGGGYELKSKVCQFSKTIAGGEYSTMIRRISGPDAPSFFFMWRDMLRVHSFFVTPAHFMVPQMVRARTPLGPGARRSGWQGCTILLNEIPPSGRIFYVQNGVELPIEHVVKQYNRTRFLRNVKKPELRGWLLDVMLCVERMKCRNFTLTDMYNYEVELSRKHPANKHVRAKIRQQLQMLRDAGYIEFEGLGKYRLTNESSC